MERGERKVTVERLEQAGRLLHTLSEEVIGDLSHATMTSGTAKMVMKLKARFRRVESDMAELKDMVARKISPYEAVLHAALGTRPNRWPADKKKSPPDLPELATPCLVVDRAKVAANAERLISRLAGLGVPLRLHVKTAKSLEVAELVLGSGRPPITVSTLREAEQFFEGGYRDVLYAVGFSPAKAARARSLASRGCNLTVITDSTETARAISGFRVLIEIDTDGHRAGVKPDSDDLIPLAQALRDAGNTVAGVMTHAGGSYDARGQAALRAIAEQERAGAVRAATRLREAGFEASIVSVGSTPTAHFAERLDGVTEVRAGVFVFFDLVMAGIGVCRLEDIALSVLTTVNGHRPDKGWILIDAGWMALSRDRGTAKQQVDQGYGLVCDLDGRPIPDLIVIDTSQEHGVIAHRSGGKVPALPVGTRLRILPNHACATGAQHEDYNVVDGKPGLLTRWPRFGGW